MSPETVYVLDMAVHKFVWYLVLIAMVLLTVANADIKCYDACTEADMSKCEATTEKEGCKACVVEITTADKAHARKCHTEDCKTYGATAPPDGVEHHCCDTADLCDPSAKKDTGDAETTAAPSAAATTANGTDSGDSSASSMYSSAVLILCAACLLFY